jgi:hypothetical protein
LDRDAGKNELARALVKLSQKEQTPKQDAPKKGGRNKEKAPKMKLQRKGIKKCKAVK